MIWIAQIHYNHNNRRKLQNFTDGEKPSLETIVKEHNQTRAAAEFTYALHNRIDIVWINKNAKQRVSYKQLLQYWLQRSNNFQQNEWKHYVGSSTRYAQLLVGNGNFLLLDVFSVVIIKQMEWRILQIRTCGFVCITYISFFI